MLLSDGSWFERPFHNFKLFYANSLGRSWKHLRAKSWFGRLFYILSRLCAAWIWEPDHGHSNCWVLHPKKGATNSKNGVTTWINFGIYLYWLFTNFGYISGGHFGHKMRSKMCLFFDGLWKAVWKASGGFLGLLMVSSEGSASKFAANNNTKQTFSKTNIFAQWALGPVLEPDLAHFGRLWTQRWTQRLDPKMDIRKLAG